MSRRFFIKILLALGLGAYFPKLAEAARLEELHTPQDDYEPLAAIKFLRQIVTKDSRSSRVIMWQSDAEEKFLLEWRQVGENSAHFSEVERRDLIYSCEIKNLKAASLYNFRIISDGRATSDSGRRSVSDDNFFGFPM